MDSNNKFNIHIYETNNATVIKEINPDLIIDSAKLCSVGIERLFPIDSVWLSLSIIFETLKIYAKINQFCIAYNGKGKIHCNRSNDNKKKKPNQERFFTNGPLQCGCDFHVQLSPSEYTVPKHDVKVKRKRPNFNKGYVKIKTFDYNHSQGCNPNTLQHQFCASRKGEYTSNIPTTVYWQLCTLMKNHPKRYVAPSTIRSSLSKCVPMYHNISKQDIFNTRIRCKRLITKFNDCDDYKQFEENLNSNCKFMKLIEKDNGLDVDETMETMKEAFDELFHTSSNSDSKQQSNNCNYETLSMKFPDYLQLISLKSKGFQYRLAIGDNEKINGVVWMTATMRSNFERFGSYICLDAMKRELNTLNWPYFGISLYNELNNVCLGCESLMMSEQNDAYEFLLKSCFEMCPGRIPDDVSIVSGDGFFTQNTLETWGLFKAKFVADYWHLFNTGLKDRFGQNHYNILADNLKRMANSYNEETLNRKFEDAKNQLNTYGINNGRVEIELQKFYDQRHSYAKYLVQQIPGNRNRRGSSCAEQNHSSVSSLVFGDKEHKDYMEHAHVMIRDLFNRQKIHTNKFNQALFGLTNKRNVKKEAIEIQYKNSDLYLIIKNALECLNYNAFSQFEKEVEECKNYELSTSMEMNDNEFITCKVVQRIDMNAPSRKFFNTDTRCNCNFRITHLMMCRHEILIHNKKFNKDLFDIMHKYRPNVTMSYNKGNHMNYKTSTTISTDIFESIDDSITGCTVDDLTSKFASITTSDSSQKTHIDNSFVDSHHEDNIDCTIFEETGVEFNENSYNNSSTNLSEHLPPKTIQNISNEIYNYYEKSNHNTKLCISSLLIMIKEMAKTNIDPNRCETLSTSIIERESQMRNIVHTYNSCFQIGNTSFDTSKSNSSNKDIQKTRTRNRHKRKHELLRESNKKHKNISQCSFCKGISHNKTNCPRLSELKTQYRLISVNEINDYINHLKKEVPILHPNNSIEVFIDILEDKHHLILHKEIYAKIKSTSDIYGYLNIDQMLFTISIISMHNASIIKSKVVVNGHELHSYILSSSKKKTATKFLFDETYKVTMYSEEYCNRIENISLDMLSLSQNSLNETNYLSNKRTAMEPPEDGKLYSL